MTNEHIVVLVQLNKLIGGPRKDGFPVNHICGMLVRYKDVFTKRLLR